MLPRLLSVLLGAPLFLERILRSKRKNTRRIASSASVPRTARRAIAQCGKLLSLSAFCSPLEREPEVEVEVEEGIAEPPERLEAKEDADAADADDADDCEREAATDEDDAAADDDA